MTTKLPFLSSCILIGLAFLFMASVACSGSSGEKTLSEPTPTVSVPESSNSVAVFLSIADLVQEVMPAVVSIKAGISELDLLLGSVPFGEGVGSGVIIDAEGLVLTSYHVIRDVQHIQVTLVDGRSYDGEVVGRDSITDLAVVRIKGDNLPALSFAPSNTLRVGDPVIAIGNALGLEGGPTVTSGVVSALDREVRIGVNQPLEGLIQTDAAINPGNSGGPLLNLGGEIIGINTAIDNQSPGIGFAVSSKVILSVLDEILAEGRVVRGFLGVTLTTVTPGIVEHLDLNVDEGVIITEVMPGTPAYEADLRPLDVVVSFDGRPVSDTDDLIQMIRNGPIGEELEIIYSRGGEETTIPVTLIERPE